MSAAIPPLRVEHPFSLDVPVYAPEHLESRIAAIVKGFDAERVHKVMTMLDWRWGGSDMPVGGVPTVEQIREKVADLLRGTAAGFIAGKIGPGSGWGSGGLRTQISDKGELTVWFELSEQALGLAEIRIRQLGEQLAACEKALAERDARVLSLSADIREFERCATEIHTLAGKISEAVEDDLVEKIVGICLTILHGRQRPGPWPFEALLLERNKLLTDKAALDKIVWGLVHNAGRCITSGRVERWAAVMKAIGCGSTRAHELCRQHGLDPDELVGRGDLCGGCEEDGGTCGGCICDDEVSQYCTRSDEDLGGHGCECEAEG